MIAYYAHDTAVLLLAAATTWAIGRQLTQLHADADRVGLASTRDRAVVFTLGVAPKVAVGILILFVLEVSRWPSGPLDLGLALLPVMTSLLMMALSRLIRLYGPMRHVDDLGRQREQRSVEARRQKDAAKLQAERQFSEMISRALNKT